MFKFLNRLIERVLGIEDLRHRLAATVRAQTQADRELGIVTKRLRAMQKAEAKRTAEPGRTVHYRNPNDPLSTYRAFGDVAVIEEVRPDGLVATIGTFIPWEWVDVVLPAPVEPPGSKTATETNWGHAIRETIRSRGGDPNDLRQWQAVIEETVASKEGSR